MLDYPANAFLEETGYTCALIPQDSIIRTFECTPCSYGTYKTEEGCTPCPPVGFYQDSLAQKEIISYGTGCKTCPPGTHVDPSRAPGKAESDCLACPKGTNLKVFAGFRACFCLLGHYRLDRYGACVVCPRGYDCVNGTVTLGSGFYWRWSDDHTKQMYTAFKDNLQITDDSFNSSLTKCSTLLPASYAGQLQNRTWEAWILLVPRAMKVLSVAFKGILNCSPNAKDTHLCLGLLFNSSSYLPLFPLWHFLL